VIYGCAGGALLTLALVVGGWVGPALLTGIATASGIIQAIVSFVKYREAAAHAAGAHDPGRHSHAFRVLRQFWDWLVP
jgi:hypothetical protein